MFRLIFRNNLRLSKFVIFRMAFEILRLQYNLLIISFCTYNVSNFINKLCPIYNYLERRFTYKTTWFYYLKNKNYAIVKRYKMMLLL